MSFPRSEEEKKVCPKTGKPVEHKSKHCWLSWLFPITGLLALIWFLIRVIPKPSRATYPCQRVAFPLASGFVTWLIGIIGSAAAYHKAKRSLAQARYVAAAIFIVASVGFVWTALSSTNKTVAYAHEPLVANSPLGEGRGIYPGRVAWIHDPCAATWPGSLMTYDWQTPPAPYWHEDVCTDPNVVSEMLSDALKALTGRDSNAAAWDAIFKQFNYQKGKGYVGYTSGEKIAIKINWVLMINKNNGTKDLTNYDQIDDSPQLAIALLRQLIDNAGVSPNDISIGDPQNNVADYWYDMVSAECPNVIYLVKNDSTLPHGTPVSPDTNAPFYWSDPCDAHWDGVTKQDHIPDYFAQADYFINFPILKSHNSSGITVNGKNNYGSLMRAPNASGYYNMHHSRPANADSSPYSTPGMGHYRANVDLMGHPKLGGKTMLVLVDFLYAGRSWDSRPIRWDMEPFNGNWPSSILLSQDQVAADSVAFDFMDNEWDGTVGTINGYPQYSGTDDYLHEAALIPSSPSGVLYHPNDANAVEVLTESLGVHEHWNNATDKQYSRNLDPVNGKGIELVTEPRPVGDFYPDGIVDFKDFAIFAAAWYSQPDDANWNPACDISESIDGIIDELDLAVFCGNWLY